MPTLSAEELFNQPVTTRTDDPDLGKIAGILGDYNATQLKLYKQMMPWWRSGWAVCGLLFLVTAIHLMWAMLFGWIDGFWPLFLLGAFLALAILFGGFHMAETRG